MSMADNARTETLRLEGVRKSYGVGTPVETEVLHGIDLEVRQRTAGQGAERKTGDARHQRAERDRESHRTGKPAAIAVLHDRVGDIPAAEEHPGRQPDQRRARRKRGAGWRAATDKAIQSRGKA